MFFYPSIIHMCKVEEIWQKSVVVVTHTIFDSDCPWKLETLWLLWLFINFVHVIFVHWNLFVFPAAGVGKTSLILSLVSEEFPDEVSGVCISDQNHINTFSYNYLMKKAGHLDKIESCESLTMCSSDPGSCKGRRNHHSCWCNTRKGPNTYCGLL